MTTRVSVDAHAGWPVKVQAIDTFEGVETVVELGTVEAGEQREFHATSSRKLLIEELPNV